MPRDPREEPFAVLVYVALPSNPLYLGHAPCMQMAVEIASTEGNCGHNVEYLARLTAFMRTEVPDVFDEHLEKLDSLAREYLLNHNPRLLRLFDAAYMADNSLFERRSISFDSSSDKLSDLDEASLAELAAAGLDALSLTESGSSGTSSPVPQFADMVSSRKSRCLNI